MGVSKTILSAGELIKKALTTNDRVQSLTARIVPVVATDGATTRYVVYRRTSLEQNPVKAKDGSYTGVFEVSCYAEKYDDSVELAEAVKNALDGKKIESDETDGINARSVTLSDAYEDYEADAFVQVLTFKIKI